MKRIALRLLPPDRKGGAGIAMPTCEQETWVPERAGAFSGQHSSGRGRALRTGSAQWMVMPGAHCLCLQSLPPPPPPTPPGIPFTGDCPVPAPRAAAGRAQPRRAPSPSNAAQLLREGPAENNRVHQVWALWGASPRSPPTLLPPPPPHLLQHWGLFSGQHVGS